MAMGFLSTVALLVLLVMPSQAATRITTRQDCYEQGENIEVTFQTDSPTVNDWVAILPPETTLDPFSAQVTVEWAYTCGSQTCERSSLRGTGSVNLASTFVPEGSWKVFLVSPGNGRWVGVAESETFELSQAGGCVSGGGGGEPSPTPPPVPRPTAEPIESTVTSVPTFSTVGSGSIETNKRNYTSGENIVITFENRNPRVVDWIGIYDISAPSNQLSAGEMWMLLCGGQTDCTTSLSAGTLVFGAGGMNEAWQQAWPLQGGTYKAIMARETGEPYQAIAESPAFTVVARPSPTSAPTSPRGLPGLEDSISTNDRQYFAGEDIIISFQSENPRVGDWVAIYEASVNTNRLSDGEMWMWVCGGKSDCSSPVQEGNLVFGKGGLEERWMQRWPLRGGTYKALLLRNNGRPWPMVAESEVFEIIDLSAMIEEAGDDIRELIAEQPGLGPKFVRLGFHDCVGPCDGCVDLLNADNNGLEVPIDALEPIVTKHENRQLGFSRADIWALAALVGADVAQPFPFVDFSLQMIGRQNCEDANNRCFNDQDVNAPCRPDRGPHRHLPHADITTADLFHFFSSEFGFNDRETVALLGAHTLGVLSRENSGFDGQDGWVVHETVLDNDYYFELVGNPDPDVDFVDQVDDAPPWFRDFEDNSDLPGIPDRNVWVAFPQGRNGQRILMLNADVALVRELTNENMDKDGKVSCAFIGEGRCPHAARSLDFVAEYRLDNNLWLNDFQDVFKRMLINGYSASQNCFNRICFLSVK